MTKFIKTMLGCVAFVLFFAMTSSAQAAQILTADDAYQGIVKIKTYSSDKDHSLTEYGEGSGFIINTQGVILTNNHVIDVKYTFDNSEAAAAYQICLTTDSDTAPNCSYTAKLIAKDEDLDLALLQIEAISGLSTVGSNFDYLNINQADNTETNDTITVLGYPGIGAETVTVTEGVITGKTSKYNKDWIKTDAVTSFGSSGGAAIDEAGNVIGIITEAYSDMAGSMGYMINVTSINSWVNTNKSKTAQSLALTSRLAAHTKKQKELESTNVFTEDYPAISLTKPETWIFDYTDEYDLYIENESDSDGGYVHVGMYEYPHDTSAASIVDWLNIIYAKEGLITAVNYDKISDITLNGHAGKKITISSFGASDTSYFMPAGNFYISISYDYGDEEKDKTTVDQVINSFEITGNFAAQHTANKYHNSDLEFYVTSDSDWPILIRDDKEKPIDLYNSDLTEANINFSFIKLEGEQKTFNNQEYLNYLQSSIEDANAIATIIDAKVEITDTNIDFSLNDELDGVLMTEAIIKKISSDEIVTFSKDFMVRIDEEYYLDISFNMVTDNKTDFDSEFNKAYGIIQSVSLEGYTDSTGNDISDDSTPPELPDAPVDQSLVNRLKGKILLQVEQNGEAWYIKPDTGTRIYMKNGIVAYDMMRNLGLGITNADLAKIPVGIETRFVETDTDGDGLGDKLEEGLKTDPLKADTDGDGYNDGTEIKSGYNPLGSGSLSTNPNLVNNLKGKILLQVESRGEAWYINPADGKRYYMKDGDSAYQIMRFLSLGITDNDLAKIPAE